MSTRRRALIAAAVLVAGTSGIAAAPQARASLTCDRVASPGGSDSLAGTLAAPLRTVRELLDSLAPGETGCLRSGSFSADQFRIKRPGITLTPYPGERATLRGRLRVEAGADGAVIEGLTLDGRNPKDHLGPLIYADRVVLRDNEITNGHTAICVHVDDYPGSPAPRGVVIERNRIHDCGELPATNHQHGIYLAESRGAVIRDNWIYSNADRGVQLYPDADRTTITGNVIDGNGQGVIFSGDSGDRSSDNLVERNLITNSTIRYNVESHWQGPRGHGNVVRENCVFGGARDTGNGGIETPPDGFTLERNVVADPGYVDRGSGDFRLRGGSRCGGVLAGNVPGGGSAKGRGRYRVTLKASSRAVRRGKRVRLRGRVKARDFAARRVVIQKRAKDGWKRVRKARIRGRNRFRPRVRVRSRRRAVRFRAKVRRVGRSRAVRVAIRR